MQKITKPKQTKFETELLFITATSLISLLYPVCRRKWLFGYLMCFFIFYHICHFFKQSAILGHFIS